MGMNTWHASMEDSGSVPTCHLLIGRGGGGSAGGAWRMVTAHKSYDYLYCASHALLPPDFPSLLQRFLNLFSVPNPLMSKRL